MSQALNRLRAMVSLAQLLPDNAAPPFSGAAVGWRDRLESDPRRGSRALQVGDRASADALRWNLDLALD
jgi:hypothetical protein